MLETLTPEQVAAQDRFRDEWLAIGLATGVVDREPAIEAARAAYAEAGLGAPGEHFFVRSPIEGTLLGAVLQTDPAEAPRLLAEFERWGTKSYESLEERIPGWFSRATIEAMESAHNGHVLGNHGAGWLAFYDYFARVCNIEAARRVIPLMNMARHCGWWIPYAEAIIFEDRCLELHRDARHELHSEAGPAIAYGDGFEIYAWHGVIVPARWIRDKENLSPEEVLAARNGEQRRAGCEILGWDRVLSELSANVIDVNDNPQIGTLVEVEIPEAGLARFLRVRCGTGREFAIPVPRETPNALAAQQWIWNDADYAPEIRT